MDTGSNRGSTGQLSSAGSTGGVGMHHSHSTPAGVDGGARTPPATPKKCGKMLAIRVQMLDDTITIFQVQAKALGSVLFEQVCKQLHLLEADYFGLEYSDVGGTRYWLDLQKPISRQLGLSLVDPLLYFCVKFYTPDPAQLEEEYTRYLFCLQIKRDLAQGIMQCNENTAALMASYIVQAECGDYVAEDYPDHTYLSSYKFVPQQDQEMERKIMENHKKHAGQSPAEADLNLLETARRCELYGMKMHPAKDHENVPLNLAVAHMGILVFQNYTKINTFSWAKIRKISFKRKRFLIKLHPEGYGYYKDTVEFFFEGRNECKNFWKKCVENHGFFRCSSVKNVSRHKTRVLSRGSSFRYSGKTQKQIIEFVRDNYVKRQTFQRSASFRHSSAHSSASNMHASTVGNSISAHPLLPLADTNLSVEAAKLSASLGSMGVAVRGEPASPTTRLASRPRGRATCWSSAPDNTALVTTPPARTTISPSPPQTTQSASPLTSATTSPLHTPCEEVPQTLPCVTSPPLAVRAAVHRADTGTTTRIISIRTPSNHKSEGSLDLDHSTSPPFRNKYPSQTQSQNDLGLRPGAQVDTQTSPEYTYKSMTSLPKRHTWQRSASCKDLYDFSFEESGEAKRRPKLGKTGERTNVSMEERKLESPITRYDDHRALYSSNSHDNSLEIHQDIMMPDQKVYSSSYPGTTSYSQESMEDPGNYDLRDSQDDLSHDSYELIEKSDDEYSSGDYKHRKVKPLNARSCSLDSGNYLPSDTDSDLDKHHKCRSSSDVHTDLFMMDDPRDFPREIIPRKSDGNFYKAFKSSSRTSSLESKSDYYDTKVIKSSKESLKRKGFGSRTSSQESRSDGESRRVTKKKKSCENLSRRSEGLDSRTSSFESKSEYYDAPSKIEEPKYVPPPPCLHDFDRKINFERNYGTHIQKHDNYFPEVNRNHMDYNGFLSMKETSHVHSVSLQNVETEQSIRANRKVSNIEQNTVPRTQKSSHLCSQSSFERTTHIWPQPIPGLPTEIPDWTRSSAEKRSTESESNIFSFDEDKIQSLQESSDLDNSFGVVPNIDSTHIEPKKDNYKSKFMEIETRMCKEPLPLHQPIERTKSDPNSLARQRINCGNRRLLLMHQKSIDLTPAESSDEDYLYKQIPSAPPIMKYRGSQFEMPTAEFGHFDILKREIEGQKTKFEVPKSQFEVLGAKTQSDLINLPPKSEEISYVLHKRHIMNGTATVETKTKVITEKKEPDEIKSPLDEAKKFRPTTTTASNLDSQFLFTQNIDLSKVDPVTLEVDKSAPPVQLISSPKRDITHVDPVMLEALSNKLSQIESDSPTSSKTDSLQTKQIISAIQKEKQIKIEVKQRITQAVQISEVDEKDKSKVEIKAKLKEKPKTEIKVKRIIKPRMQPGKKGLKTTKTKVRITSFSSDDESLDSDDVFGSAEATPTRVEFSPPQTRKEMESILKFESERKYLQYTMSSTEVEGSPPTTRKKTEKKYEQDLDVNMQPELRRISERSISIPSSEDDLNIKTSDMQPVFGESEGQKDIDKDYDDKSQDETLKEETVTEKRKECPPIEEERDLDKERENEKALLMAEIENDLKDLKVPPKTKITELTSPSLRKKGKLFAHARLNLSEGSALTLLQKQQAAESPISGRRAISLDAPIIPVSRLPPLNAFSSKDDTVEENESDINKYALTSGPSEESVSDKSKPEEPKDLLDTTKRELLNEAKPPIPPRGVEKLETGKSKPETIKTDLKPIKLPEKERDQIVPDVSSKNKKMKTTVQTKTYTQKAMKHKMATLQRTKEVKQVISKEKPIVKPARAVTKTITTTPQQNTCTAPKIEKAEQPISEAAEKRKAFENKTLNLKDVNALTVPEMKKARSQEIESNKQIVPKEKARSLDKLEFKRTGSKERSKSQDESDSEKRKEKQQMLYETAIKQTKTIKSPVKDVLPVFPQVEEMVRERHGKLEISINTIENTGVSLEEAIIITKSPKKLDKKIDKKLTKSLELNLSLDNADAKISRLGKSLDLDNRPSQQNEEKSEFDFKQEAVSSYQETLAKESEASSQDKQNIQETSQDINVKEVDADKQPTTVITDTNGTQDKIVLEGTSLDVWLSMNSKETTGEKGKLDDIKVIQKSDVFFEERIAKAPDLNKIETKSSSDSQSIEKVSLGNSLDIKYIDDSGDSSHKSDQDAQLVAQMQKASATVNKFIRKKLANRQKATDKSFSAGDNLIKITSEDESLGEVSELKQEDTSGNFLSVDRDPRKTLTKTSIDRSRSEETTGSWMTVECDEFIGTEESFDSDNQAVESPEKVSAYDEDEKTLQAVDDVKHELKATDIKITTEKTENTLSLKDTRLGKLDLLKSSDQSKSSDTTGSWTSGEKELSPGNVKETDESSASSIGKAIGLSQTIEVIASRDLHDRSPSESEPPRSPRSPRICVLGRAFTIDEESYSQHLEGKEILSELSSDEAQDIPKDADRDHKSAGVLTEKSFEELDLKPRMHKKISRSIASYAEKSNVSSLDDSFAEKKKSAAELVEKPSLYSLEKLSTDSRNSLDTESSSGSLGLVMRQKSGEIPRELSSTWKPFPLGSSDSESFDDGLLPPDQDLDKQDFYIGRESAGDMKGDLEGAIKDDTELPEDLANFSTSFGYPSLLSDIGGLTISLSTSDVLPGYGAAYLSRTLSRISERSTNSEKSSLEEDMTKATTQSDSLNDESLASSNPQMSLSSDPPSNAHISENGKKSSNGASPSAKNGKISEGSSGKQGKQSDSSSDKQRRPSDSSSGKQDYKFCSERGGGFEQIPNLSHLLQRQISDDRRTSAEMAELSMDDIEIITSERGLKLRRQGSDDTIIDEEPFETEQKDEDKRGSSSQESDDWPLPEIPQQGQRQLLAMHEVPSSDTSQQTTQVFQPPKTNIPKVFGLRGSLKSQDSEQWPSPPSSVTEPLLTGNVETYYMNPPETACMEVVDSKSTTSHENDSGSDSENKTLELDTEKTHTYENVATEHASESISESLSVGTSGVKIVLDTKSLYQKDSNSDDEDLNLSNLNDDVFTDTVDSTKNELRPPTVLRRSTASDDSSHSGKKSESGPSRRKASHSSYSDEECTSSMTTHFEDGTVRFALKPTKCTHSSHSEDTSVALSLSEWSNSTNTVKFHNLSSNSGTTKSSSGLKSEDNSLTDIALSEWSSSNSNTLKAQQSSSLQFQKLSSTTSTGDSTLTDLMPTISEWSSSESKTLVHQPLFTSSLTERQPVTTRLGSSIDDGELEVMQEKKGLPSPKNIPSEDLALLSPSAPTKSDIKSFTKSTERPIVIPLQIQSDTEKSSSSVEHKTIHTQRYDKDKQKYLQKQSSQSPDKPVKSPLKLSKCSPYYSSSLSSESTPLASTSPIPMSKTATVPLTRSHRKPISRSLFQAKSPPSENDSTSSVESPKSKSDRDRRGYRRRRQTQTQRRHKIEKEQHAVDEYFYVESETGLTEYSEYLHHKNLQDLASSFAYECSVSDRNGIRYVETLEEGYYPDVDSQSGSDIFRMEKDEDDRYDTGEGFDVSCIPPPLLEDDLEDSTPQP